MSKFNKHEVRCLRFLAERYDSGERDAHLVHPSELPDYADLGHDKIDDLIRRFIRYGLIRWISNERFMPTRRLIALVHQIDNPPPKNYWHELFVWWFRSRWRTAVFVVTVLLPAIVQWGNMIQAVLKWFST